MSALTKPQDNLPAEQPAALTMLDIINRAAFDENVSAEKVERLMDMALKVRAVDAKAAYTSALVKMKPLLPIIDRRGRIVIHEKGKDKIPANITQSTPYALWEDIDAALTPILHDHGFVLTFRTGTMPDGRVKVTGVLSHEQGHSEESEMALPLDTSGSKNNVQAAGSSTSYGKRYTATALLNIRTKGEDDDGEGDGGYHTTSTQGGTNPIAEAMEDEIADGVKNWCDEQKKFLTNCATVGDVLEWEELRKDALGRLRRKALPAWNDLRKFKEARIGNINLAGVKTP